MRRVMLLGGTVLLVVLYVGYRMLTDESANSYRMAEVARSRVHAGMPLDEAEQVLGREAWHHVTCGAERSEHVFLFGSRNMEKTGVVYLRAEGPPGQQVVAFVGSVENYRLILYDHCSDIDLRTGQRKELAPTG